MNSLKVVIEYFWGEEISESDLAITDYVKMFGLPIGVASWIAFLMLHITW